MQRPCLCTGAMLSQAVRRSLPSEVEASKGQASNCSEASAAAQERQQHERRLSSGRAEECESCLVVEEEVADVALDLLGHPGHAPLVGLQCTARSAMLTSSITTYLAA